MLTLKMEKAIGEIAPSGRKRIYLGFWILVTLIFLYDRTYLITKAGLPYFLICAIVRISLLIALAWANINILIPRYLFPRKYSSYFASVVLLIVAYLVVQSLFDYYLYGFVIAPTKTGQLSATLIYNFTHTSLYLLLTVALKFSIDWYEQKKTLDEVKVEKLQTEVNYLRSQVNPHFLFNALNNLYGLTLKKSDQAPGAVLKLSELMEYMLYESDAEYVSLEQEVNYLRNYLELEKLREDNKTDIQLVVMGNTNEYQMPPFLILPIVENAFKHGVNKTSPNAFLHINIHADNNCLTARVVNSKPDISAADQNKGIGLTNLKKRLDLLFPGKHTLDILDGSDRFEVTLKINGHV
jgi:sensor histidine kinase YesM